MNYKKLTNITGYLVFIITFIVYYFSVERTGSLWDCGEFISGAYKLEVVHPPGASLFILVGSLFTNIAKLLSDNPSDIAFAVNLMSGLFSALAAMFIAWTTIILGKLAFAGKGGKLNKAQMISVAGGGFVAGLSAAFAISIWFSAVEGEVYSMSTFFTALTIWAAFKWYNLPDTKESDRWLLFAVFSIALSTGVHLLSVLAFPIIALLFYYKKYKTHTTKGIIISLVIGVLMIGIVLKVIIAGIPTLWTWWELFTVNTLGLAFHSGLIPTILTIGGLIYLGLWYAKKHNNYLIHLFSLSVLLLVIGFSTIGIVVVRANADTPINMNVPSDAFRLLPYLNREQYGERPLLRGPHYKAKPEKYETTPRYGKVGDKYEIVNEKITPVYKEKDMMWFPRIGHNDGAHTKLYEAWGAKKNGRPGMGFNLSFFFRYQLGWMYWRYFAWNFIGKQNKKQGYFSWDVSKGNWISGIKPIDDARLYNSSFEPDSMKRDQAHNTYYFLPFLFGLLGLLFQYQRRKKEFFAILILFLITGIGIIIYSNQPPNEPRERDYVLAGSVLTFAMWIGLAVPALYSLLIEKLKFSKTVIAGLSFIVVLSAPVIMGFQNYDDMSRMTHYATRDYASNFLNSCDKNAIIFTYGDNDTYPLWYAQEVEGIRTDVRVVNLSLIAVDWYINKLRNKVNNSPAIKLSIPPDSIRGNKRNQMVFYNPNLNKMKEPWPLKSVLKFMAGKHPIRGNNNTFPSYIPTQRMYIPVNKEKAIKSGWVSIADSANIVDSIPLNFDKKTYLTKDDIAILDILANNLGDRPIYFSVTVRNEKLMGLNNYTELEGLGLRIIPVKSKGDKRMGIYGSGRVDADKIYENVMTKWKWGNFNTHETFIDESYSPEISAMKMVMTRGAKEFIARGEKKKAADLAKKYFEAFPHYNFPYDYSVIPFIEVLVSAGEIEEAEKHIDILANEVDQYMQFFYSLDKDDLNSFDTEIQKTQLAIGGLLRLLPKLNDKDYQNKIETMLKPYMDRESLQ